MLEEGKKKGRKVNPNKIDVLVLSVSLDVGRFIKRQIDIIVFR